MQAAKAHGLDMWAVPYSLNTGIPGTQQLAKSGVKTFASAGAWHLARRYDRLSADVNAVEHDAGVAARR